jgi:tripeptidyl-peptidase-1
MVATTLFWSSLFALVAGSPISRRRVLQSSRGSSPHGFVSLGAAQATQPIELRFALASQDIAGLEKALLDVSTPSSPNYGKHLTKAEVRSPLSNKP